MRIRNRKSSRSSTLAAKVLIGLVCSIVLPDQTLRAEILNFTFTGTVTFVDNSGFLLNNSVGPGTPIQGFFIFDSSTLDSNSDANVGDYRHTNSIAGIVVKAGNYVFRTDPQHVNFLIEAVNRPSDDDIVLHSYNNVCTEPLVVDHIAWQLSDNTGSALTNASLPIVPPDLPSFSQDFGLTINGGFGMKGYFIRATVTNIVAAPVVIPQRPATTMKDAVELSWPSVLGYFYQVQMSGDMTNWSDLGEPILGDGTIISKFVAKPQGTNAYFRAEIANHP